ncbi:MAG: M28 family peptidase, partial [Chloroflexia bacterium]|nr:M28 family peptidase [Chloroflexia bacterium]
MTETTERIAGWQDATLERAVLDTISLDAPWATVETFSKLVRLSGEPEERQAVDYLIERLQSWGVPHQLHEPVCFISLPREATLRVDGPNGTSYRAKTAAMGVSTDGRELSAELVYAPPRVRDDVADDWSYGLDFTGIDATGKIVIADGMAAPGRVIDVMAAGALAGIFVNPGAAIHESICTTIWGTPDHDSAERQPTIPVLGVNHADGTDLIALAKRGGRVAFSTRVETGWRPIPVLVAEIPGTEAPDEFVLLHGHLDSWHEGVGDNATGDATMLELARVFWQHRESLARGVRIAWWSGHSHGRYAGSTWYADAYGLDLARGCVAQINCDSPGCRWADTYNELTCMSEAESFVDTVIRQTTGITPETERPPRAGDYSFNGVGISSFYMLSSTMSPEARAAKGYYPVGGCGANIAWHTEDDTLEIADRDNLLRDLRMYGASVLRVVNAPLHPFDWRTTMAEFRTTLDRYQEAAGGVFDFTPAQDAVDQLDAALGRFYGSAPADAAPGSPAARRFNRAQRRLALLLVPVNYSRETPFHHDPAMEVPPLPDLAPALGLATAGDDPARRGTIGAA